jgi:hypothetical protein
MTKRRRKTSKAPRKIQVGVTGVPCYRPDDLRGEIVGVVEAYLSRQRPVRAVCKVPAIVTKNLPSFDEVPIDLLRGKRSRDGLELLVTGQKDPSQNGIYVLKNVRGGKADLKRLGPLWRKEGS